MRKHIPVKIIRKSGVCRSSKHIEVPIKANHCVAVTSSWWWGCSSEDVFSWYSGPAAGRKMWWLLLLVMNTELKYVDIVNSDTRCIWTLIHSLPHFFFLLFYHSIALLIPSSASSFPTWYETKFCVITFLWQVANQTLSNL